MLALDRPTKSIVVAIRGTVSVADLATDMLADPEPMEEWLPDTMTEVGHAVAPAHVLMTMMIVINSDHHRHHNNHNTNNNNKIKNCKYQ